MKTIIFVLLGILMLFGLISLFQRTVNDGLAVQSGETPVTLASINRPGDQAGRDMSRPFMPMSEIEEDLSAETGARMQKEESRSGNHGPGLSLFVFSGGEPAWYTVNDDVMGGISNSRVVVDTGLQRLSFTGAVSLENNGGFASARSQWTSYDLGAYDGIVLRVRGDGKSYRFRVYTEETGSALAYTSLFDTDSGRWQEVYIPFSEMVPLYRGFVVEAAGPLSPQSIRSFGLMLTDKQTGEFSLDIDWIDAVTENKVAFRYAKNSAK